MIERIETEDGLRTRYTFAGSTYFERMKELDLYSTDSKKLKTKFERLDLIDIFNVRLV